MVAVVVVVFFRFKAPRGVHCKQTYTSCHATLSDAHQIIRVLLDELATKSSCHHKENRKINKLKINACENVATGLHYGTTIINHHHHHQQHRQ